ncbi:MAG: queuosine precursor transporter [Planctomycetes bacterium]|nr:queuosine precursor transporter [Planctomycetota bacterium]
MAEIVPPPVAETERKETLLLVLCALFIGFFVTADLMGAKLWHFTILGLRPRHLGLGGDEFIATTGILAFPLTFILTDIVNEYYGRKVVRTLTILAIMVNLLLQPVVQTAIRVPTITFGGPTAVEMHQAYQLAFGQTWSIVVASLCAFTFGQFLDIWIFTWLRRKTGGRMLWLRAQGSTLVSQLIDTFVVIFLAFVIIPALVGGQPWPVAGAFTVSLTNYIYKFVIAVAVTPVLYLVHFGVDAWLGKDEAAIAVREAHPADPA